MAHKELSSLQGYKLYRHTSPSGKVYIGITKTSVYARKGQKNTLSMVRKKSKPVIQFSLDGKYITEYLSISEASSATGANIKGIRNCCNGGYFCKTKNRFVNIHKAGGYIWKYKEDLLCQ